MDSCEKNQKRQFRKDNSAQVAISFIHSGHFYSTTSSPLLLRSAPDTARILCRSFTPKCHRQLRVKDLPKIFTWRLERDSNLQPSERGESTNEPPGPQHLTCFKTCLQEFAW